MFNKQGQQISARKTTESSELSLLLRVLGSFGTALGFRKAVCFWCVLLLFIAKNPVNMCLSREARRRRIFLKICQSATWVTPVRPLLKLVYKQVSVCRQIPVMTFQNVCGGL